MRLWGCYFSELFMLARVFGFVSGLQGLFLARYLAYRGMYMGRLLRDFYMLLSFTGAVVVGCRMNGVVGFTWNGGSLCLLVMVAYRRNFRFYNLGIVRCFPGVPR